MHTANSDSTWSISYSTNAQLNRLLWLREASGLSSYVGPAIPRLDPPARVDRVHIADQVAFLREWLRCWEGITSDLDGMARRPESIEAYPTIRELLELKRASIAEWERERAQDLRRERSDERANFSGEVEEIMAQLGVDATDFRLAIAEMPTAGEVVLRPMRGNLLVSRTVGVDESRLREAARPAIVELMVGL